MSISTLRCCLKAFESTVKQEWSETQLFEWKIGLTAADFNVKTTLIRRSDVMTTRVGYPSILTLFFDFNRYAGVRVDMRGCGDSTGKVQDEYVLQEQEDAVECINWIKRQPWCSGNVGMMGISWGGFNSLQVCIQKTSLPDTMFLKKNERLYQSRIFL